MSVARKGLTLAKKLLFRNTLIPHEFAVVLPDPQSEIAVWLCGMGAVREVTNRYTTACCGKDIDFTFRPAIPNNRSPNPDRNNTSRVSRLLTNLPAKHSALPAPSDRRETSQFDCPRNWGCT